MIPVTGFSGGAICTHVRLGEFGSPPQLIALAIAFTAWGGVYLRDARLRALLPIRTASAGRTAASIEAPTRVVAGAA